jgi:hypothetical protein
MGKLVDTTAFSGKVWKSVLFVPPSFTKHKQVIRFAPPQKNVAISGGNNQKHCHWEKEYVDDCEGLSAREIKPIWLPRDHHIKLTHFEQWVRPCNFFDMSK